MVVYTITLSPGKLKLETFRGQPGHHSKTTLKKKKNHRNKKGGREGKGSVAQDKFWSKIWLRKAKRLAIVDLN